MAPESIGAAGLKSLPTHKAAPTGKLELPPELEGRVAVDRPRMTADLDTVDPDLAHRGDHAGRKKYGEMPWDAKPKAAEDGGDEELPWEDVDQDAARAQKRAERTEQRDETRDKIDSLQDKVEGYRDQAQRFMRRIRSLRRRGKGERVQSMRERIEKRHDRIDDVRQNTGKLQRSLNVTGADGKDRAVNQFFPTSCVAVEGMAAWARKDGKAYDAALTDLKTKGECKLPSGETLKLTTATRAEVMETVRKNASPGEIEQALMQAALMKHVNPSWDVDSAEGLKAADVRQMAQAMNTGLFMPQALIEGQAMSPDAIKDQLGGMLKRYDAVSVVVGKGDLQHTISIEKTKDGQYKLLEGNQEIFDKQGNPMKLDLDQLNDLLASGELNAGGYRGIRAVAATTGEV